MANSPMVLPEQNQRDVALRGAIALGYLSLRHGATKAPNFADFGGGQELTEMGDEPGRNRVAFIAGVGNPLKIGRRAIGLNAVNVVDVGEPIRIRDEGESDEAVDIKGLSAPLAPQDDLRVADLIDARPQHLPVTPSRTIQSVTDSIDAGDAAEVAYDVSVAKSIIRYWSPSLANFDIHVVGRLSDETGWVVKNPPRALTFGGFAHTKARRALTQVTEA